MDELELLCPSCDQILVLDAGFAGGVCRCSNCGMLMSVPVSGKPQRPSSSRRPDLPGQSTPTRRSREQTDARQPVRALPAEDASLSELPITVPVGRPRTASRSRRRRPSRAAKTPFLQNRKLMIRVSVIGIILLITVGLVLVLSAYVHYQANRPPPGQETPQEMVTFEYDANTNPYLLDKPNLLGIPLSANTVMVVEASQGSRPWLGLVKNAILTGTNFDSSLVAVQLIFATEEEIMIFPENPESLDQLDRSSLRRQLNQIFSLGSVDTQTALQRALGPKPEQLILVTGEKPSPEMIRHLQVLLKLLPDARFDAVLIDTHATNMTSLPRDRGGKYIELTAQQLQNWRYQTQ